VREGGCGMVGHLGLTRNEKGLQAALASSWRVQSWTANPNLYFCRC